MESKKQQQIISNPAFSLGNRVDDHLLKVGSSSPVVACKYTTVALLKGDMDARRRVGRGWPQGNGSHTNAVVGLLSWKGIRGSPLKKSGEMVLAKKWPRM